MRAVLHRRPRRWSEFSRRVFVFVWLAPLLAGWAPAATLVWTNTAGGGWTTPANWSPNQIPVNGDALFITNSGTYTVLLNTNVNPSTLELGPRNGAGGVMLAANGFTL